jgi:hypothetical protein
VRGRVDGMGRGKVNVKIQFPAETILHLLLSVKHSCARQVGFGLWRDGSFRVE